MFSGFVMASGELLCDSFPDLMMMPYAAANCGKNLYQLIGTQWVSMERNLLTFVKYTPQLTTLSEQRCVRQTWSVVKLSTNYPTDICL